MYTPIEIHQDILVKRDDLYKFGTHSGGKVRTCVYLAKGAKGLITAGSRHSPQVAMVSYIAKQNNIPCRVHIPIGDDTTETIEATNNGAEIIRHKPGYNSVIVKRANADATVNKQYTYIPFGMECVEAVNQTKQQVNNLIGVNIKRIVIPVGSGMSLAGLLTGLIDNNLDIPVLGIQVGADPIKRLNKYAPFLWKDMVEIKKATLPYGKLVEHNMLGDLVLDPIYEAKCIEHLKCGDLLWVVGIRKKN